MSTKTKASKKSAPIAQPKADDAQRTKHMAIGFAAIGLVGAGLIAATKAVFDVASETI